MKMINSPSWKRSLKFLVFVMFSCQPFPVNASSRLLPVETNDNTTDICQEDFSKWPQEMLCICSQLSKDDRDSSLDYLSFHYCTMSSSSILSSLSIFLLILWLVYLFYVIAGTSDNYLVPALTVGVDILHISPNIAGATILAFANGAPDLFTSVAAFSGNSTDDDLGLGAIIGGGVFLTTCTFGCVILMGHPITIHRRPLFRDLLFYSIGLSVLLYIVLDRRIYMSECCILLGLYVIYVLVLLIGRYVYQNYIKPRRQNQLDFMGDDRDSGEILECSPSTQEEISRMRKGEHSAYVQMVTPQKYDIIKALEDGVWIEKPVGKFKGNVEEDVEDAEQASITSMREFEEENYVSVSRILKKSHVRLERDTYSTTSESRENEISDKEDNFCKYGWKALTNVLKFLTQWEEQSKLGKFLVIAEFPFILLRRLTIPMVDEENWSRLLSALSMVFGPLFITYQLISDFEICFITMVIGFVLACVSWNTTTSHAPTTANQILFYVSFAFIMSCFWAYMIANELVSIMQCIGLGIGVSNGVLGVTVLAWGNSIGDFVSNLALAKHGRGVMAIAACFGGPIFNLLVGGGLSLLLGSLQNYPLSVSIGSSDNVVVSYSFLFIGISLLSTMIVVPFCGFQLSKCYGFWLICVYAVFLVVSVLAESDQLPKII